MTRPLRIIAAALFGLLVMYLASSFIAWSFNPAHWAIQGRFFTACFGLILAASAAAAEADRTA